jgi:hypothetical protein
MFYLGLKPKMLVTPDIHHYQKAITARLEKYRADPARDNARLKELQPLEQRYRRLVAERKGVVDDPTPANAVTLSG